MSGTAGESEERWTLTLYVSRASPHSLRAIETLRRLCDDELAGRADLEIIDVSDQPSLLARDGIVAAPTLIKRRPRPLRRLVGNLGDPDRVRFALDLGSALPGARLAARDRPA